jgi:hypothetical protein
LNDQQECEHVGLSKIEDARRDLVGADHPFNTLLPRRRAQAAIDQRFNLLGRISDRYYRHCRALR